jgi:hypothetical protein
MSHIILKTALKRIWTLCVYVFAAIGLILVAVYGAVEFGWTNTKGIVDTQHDYFKNQLATSSPQSSWSNGDEWSTFSEAVKKDSETINSVSKKTGVPTRLIVAPLVVEQLRLFYSEREIFKTIFGPLKILGNQSQFSWGVMGIKQDTAIAIEKNLKDPSSPWYLGTQYEHLLDYSATTTSDEKDSTRFARLTDEHDRYYSYLYGAVYIKELMAQWSHAGVPLEKEADSVGIIATLYNIGFTNSKPHANPNIGGAEIDIGTTTYSFGGLAQTFYDSNELIDTFPR